MSMSRSRIYPLFTEAQIEGRDTELAAEGEGGRYRLQPRTAAGRAWVEAMASG